MADPNAFALNLELTLQDNATKVLQDVTGQLGLIEQKVSTMMANLSMSIEDISTKINKIPNSFKQMSGKMSQGIKDVQAAVASVDFAGPTDKLNTAIGGLDTNIGKVTEATEKANKGSETLAQSVSSATSSFAIPVDMVNQLRKAMIDASSIDFLKDDNISVDKAIKAYDFLTKIGLPQLEAFKQQMAKEGRRMSTEELAFIEKIRSANDQFYGKQVVMEIHINKLREKWRGLTKKDFVVEKVSRLKLLLMGKQQRDVLVDMNKALINRTKIQKQAAADPAEKQRLGGQLKQLQLNEQLTSNMGATATAVSGLKAAFEAVGGAIKSALSTIGMPALAGAATAAGLYGQVVDDVIKKEEKFHTANYRVLGSAQEINDTLRQMALKELPYTRDELIATTQALRQAGMAKEDIKALREEVMYLVRTVGADNKVTARFSQNWQKLGGTLKGAQQQMVQMEKWSKETGLEGEDLNAVMQAAGDSATLLGIHGEKAMKGYTNSMLGGAAAAKKMGLSAQEGIKFIEKMKDPMHAVAMIGELELDPTKRIQKVSKAAQQMMKDLESTTDPDELYAKQQEYMALTGSSFEDLTKNLKIMAGTNQEVQNAAIKGVTADIPDINKEMKKGITDAGTTAREVALTEDKAIAQMQETATGFRGVIRDLYKLFASDPIYPALLGWGVAGLGAVSGIVSLTASCVTLWTTFTGGASAAATATTALAGAEGTAAAATTGLTASTTPLLALLAGPLIVGIVGAIAIWKTYQAALANDEAWKTARHEINATQDAIKSAKDTLEKGGKLAKADDSIELRVDTLKRKLAAHNAELKNTAGFWGKLFVQRDTYAPKAEDAKHAEVRLQLEKELVEATEQKNAGMQKNQDQDLAAIKAGKELKVISKEQAEADFAAGKAVVGMTQERADYLKSIVKSGAKVIDQTQKTAEVTPVTKPKPTEEELDKLITQKSFEANLRDDNSILSSKATLEKAAPKLEQLAEAHPILTEKATPEPIITVKMNDTTARPQEDTQNVEGFQNVVGAIKTVFDKLDPSVAKEIVALLRDNLPKLGDKETGLASTANQWI